MRELELDERKKIGISIMDELDAICERPGIESYIEYGTLIGAVRHHGFIPWDDDVDVWIPIEDYERLLDILKKESSYQVINHLSNNDWPRSFSKLSDPETLIVDTSDENRKSCGRGVAVDLFPLFPCLNDEKWISNLVNERNAVISQFCMEKGVYLERSGIKNKAKHFVCKTEKTFGKDLSYHRIKLLSLEKEIQTREYLGCVISPYEARDIHRGELFASSAYMEFEGKEYKVPAGWDEILSSIYGDYMQLPPVEKRVSNHNVKAYRIKD